MMPRLKKIEKRLERVRTELAQIRDMRPGSISQQFKDPNTRSGGYYQLSYTYKMKSRTEYVRQGQLTETTRQTAEFYRFRRLIDLWIDLSIEHARLKAHLTDRRIEAMETRKKSITHKEVTIAITLCHTNPPIWRKLHMSSGMTLDHLHYAIQGSFGWKNCHLHSFTAGDKQRYSSNQINIDEGDEIDSRGVTLDQLLAKKINSLKYNYDFGDSWAHEITLEASNKTTDILNMATCVDGKGHCPPEDCGGIPGFERFLQAMDDKKHPEHKDLKTWFGGTFDPEKFSVVTANKGIKLFQKYATPWL
jgi:hypothetical protein